MPKRNLLAMDEFRNYDKPRLCGALTFILGKV